MHETLSLRNAVNGKQLLTINCDTIKTLCAICLASPTHIYFDGSPTDQDTLNDRFSTNAIVKHTSQLALNLYSHKQCHPC